MLRLRFARKLGIKTLLCIHADKVQVVISIGAKHRLNFIPLVLAQQTMIYKHTGQLIAYRFRQKNGRHGRIHSSGQGAEHLSATHALADCLDRFLHKSIHPPVSGAAADVAYKIEQHLRAFYCVQHLRVELNRI